MRIYFKDPNGLSLEYCCVVGNRTENDATMHGQFAGAARRVGTQQCAQRQSACGTIGGRQAQGLAIAQRQRE